MSFLIVELEPSQVPILPDQKGIRLFRPASTPISPVDPGSAAQPMLFAQLTSLDTFIEVHKRLLLETKVIDAATVRRPHVAMTDDRWQRLRQLHSACGLDAFLLRRNGQGDQRV